MFSIIARLEPIYMHMCYYHEYVVLLYNRQYLAPFVVAQLVRYLISDQFSGTHHFHILLYSTIIDM